MEIAYFLDAYALIEIIRGNENYKKYLNSKLFTSILNLYELYYNLLKDYNESEAKKLFFRFCSLAIPIKNEHIFLASLFKLKNKEKNISYTDALGYIIAKKNNMKFLTGDQMFRKAANTEFVK